jgi:hypothetical protein
MPIPLADNNSAFGYAALGANTTGTAQNVAIGGCVHILLVTIPLQLIIQRLAMLLLMPIPLEEIIQRLAICSWC